MDKKFMERAIDLAKIAAKAGEIPVGAVIVQGDRIIAEGINTRERENTALGHAEINAIAAACKAKEDWRLDDCDLYVTLEPCVMCAGAILNARIKNVIFGAYDYTAGAMGSAQNVVPQNSMTTIYSGICETECTEILKDFFKEMRK
jgi:tRNA(adenine34) deaminase